MRRLTGWTLAVGFLFVTVTGLFAAPATTVLGKDSGFPNKIDDSSVPSGAVQENVAKETLLDTDAAWNGVPYVAYPAGRPELTVLRMTIPAHAELPWHSHPMPNAAYVVSGEVTVEAKSGEKKLFSAGQVIPETVNTVHRGIAGDTPVVLIVFYPRIANMPLSQAQP